MGITYEDAVKAQTQIEDKILADPNVVSVGIIAETDEFGKSTGNYAVQVGVISIDSYLRAKKQGQSAIPTEFLLPSKDEAGQEKHIHIHVVREGKIEALTNFPKNSANDIPSAIDDDLPESAKSTVSYTLKRRPSPCGHSIGHPDVTAGTLGLLLEYTEGPNVGKAYILSNNHVIAANNLASVGDNIIQPAKHDSGRVDRDTIAFLHRWVPLINQDFNFVDAAIAEVKGGTEWSSYVSPYITHIGIPEKLADPSIGMNVEKVGRTTGYTRGEIISARFSTKINYPMGMLTFRHQIRTTSMSKPGDSGSCLIEQGTKKPVGLLFAGSDTASYCNPMSKVLSALSTSYINKYPSGRTHTFSPDYPLRILQKRTYLTYAAPSFSRNSIVLTKGLKVPLTKYGAAIAIASIGLYATTKKVSCIHSSDQSVGKIDGLLSNQTKESTKTPLRSGIEFKR